MMSTKKRNWIITIAAAVLVVVIAGAWLLTPVTVVANAKASRQFQAECDYDKFRQILVRTNATKSIVENGGMELLDEKVNDVKLDASKDRQPLLNAIRGKSKTELDATKIITVRLTDPSLKADRLKLKQQADIDNNSLHVNTDSIEEAGNLKQYQNSLQAAGKNAQTEVQLDVSMQVEMSVPRLFSGRVQSQVQQAAEQGLNDQEKALKTLVAEHADKRIIVPDIEK